MNIGFNTLCFFGRPLDETISFAAQNGFSSLEVVCSPQNLGKTPLHVDIENFNEEKAQSILEKLRKNSVKISCLSYYSNIFFPVNDNPDYHTNFIKKMIDTAEILNIELVSTYTGYNPYCSMDDNLNMLKEKMEPLLTYAGEKKIKIMLENIPLISGEPYGGSFAYSPEIWDMIFTKIPHSNFGINYDPSHLFWLGVDYLLFLGVFSDRIFHVKAKDAEILVEKLRITGIFGSSWFRYRIPGLGSIDWKKFISGLFDAGYDGVLSINNEDPVWMENPQKIERGLLFGKKFLQNLLI